MTEHTIRLSTADASKPMTVAEVERFTAAAREAGAVDDTPVKFDTTLTGRSRALTTIVTSENARPHPATADNQAHRWPRNIEVKT